jgi:hypothetical protein
MLYRLCPSCHAGLEFPEGLREPELTCPSCLANVPNPGASIQARPPTSRPAPVVLQLADDEPFDAVVRKDTRRSGLLLAVLASVFIAITLVLVFFAHGMPALGLLVIVLAAVTGGILLLSGLGQTKKARSSAELESLEPPGGRGRERRGTAAVAVGTGVTAALGGCALGTLVTTVVAIMLLIAVVAAIGNAIETCLRCGNPPAQHK